jgi:DNA-binding Lrp family transcriptional regulator
VDPRALGIATQALIFVRLVRHAREQVRSFRKHALSLREAIGVFHVAGQHDFLVHVGVRDANHLRDLAMDAFTSRPEVARIETHLIFEHVPRPQLPILAEMGDEGRRPRRRRRP